MIVRLNFKTIKFNLLKIATDFLAQVPYSEHVVILVTYVRSYNAIVFVPDWPCQLSVM